MTIIDAHHHIWRRADLPWLLGPTQPRIFGEYDAIKRDYLIDEFRKDVSGTGVTGSVYVQANWSPNWFEDEVAWVSRVADESGWPMAISAFCDMTQDDARPHLTRLAAWPRVRGIRHQMHWHHNPLYRFAPTPDRVAHPAVMQNVAALAEYGFLFELQVFAGQIEPALELVSACPDTTFVLQHALMLQDTSEEGRAAWAAALQRLAAHSNVACKLSGLGTFARRLDPPLVDDIVKTAIDAFGPSRCLYGSNFPIEKLWTDYGSLINAVKAALSDRSAEDERLILHDVAARVYRL